jgi:hypothetical protein
MSWQAQNWVRDHSPTKGTARQILDAIAYYHNAKTGLTCPSVDLLVTHTGRVESTVKEGIKKLEGEGHLLVHRDPRPGRSRVNRYTIVGFSTAAGKGPTVDPFRGEKGADPPKKRGRSTQEKGPTVGPERSEREERTPAPSEAASCEEPEPAECATAEEHARGVAEARDALAKAGS